MAAITFTDIYSVTNTTSSSRTLIQDNIKYSLEAFETQPIPNYSGSSQLHQTTSCTSQKPTPPSGQYTLQELVN